MPELINAINWHKFFDEDLLYEYVMRALEDYEKLGPIIGISLPFIEAIFPFLPLIVFVFVNIAAFGLIKGFFYSWTGSVLGALVVFFTFRRLGNTRLLKRVRHNEQVQKITQIVDRRGFGLIFLLLCFPFSPSFVINIVSGLAKVSWKQFALAVILGKAVMIFSVSFVGENIFSFAEHPIRTILIAISIMIFWLIGKQLENHIQKRAEK